VHPAYNPSFSACIFLSQQCFSTGLSAQPNGAGLSNLNSRGRDRQWQLTQLITIVLPNQAPRSQTSSPRRAVTAARLAAMINNDSTQ
jgi:hypothetical protein